jgi:hypothetical protein
VGSFRTKSISLLYHWRRKNIFGVTFPIDPEGINRARAWTIEAMRAGYRGNRAPHPPSSCADRERRHVPEVFRCELRLPPGTGPVCCNRILNMRFHALGAHRHGEQRRGRQVLWLP